MKSGYILVDVQSYIVSVALLEDGVLREYYVEYADSTDITGNIYKGRVVNILAGLQSAFVDFGNGKNGFLSVDEMLAHRSMVSEAGVRWLPATKKWATKTWCLSGANWACIVATTLAIT